jgi:hypothetical protein
MSNEWLREGELSLEPLQIKHPSSSIRCRIRDQDVIALYNPTVGANIMSDNFALAFLGGEALAPTGRTLKGPSGSLMGSYGVIQNMSVWHKAIKASLNFHVFEVPHFDILIGHPIEKLLIDLLDSGSLSIRLGNESHAIPITQTINTVAEISPITVN